MAAQERIEHKDRRRFEQDVTEKNPGGDFWTANLATEDRGVLQNDRMHRTGNLNSVHSVILSKTRGCVRGSSVARRGIAVGGVDFRLPHPQRAVRPVKRVILFHLVNV